MAFKRAESNVSVNQNLPNKLLSCLYSQRKTGKFCDIILNVGGVKFSVHSCVLASFSPYFNDMLLSPSPEVLHVPTNLEQNKNCHRNESLSKEILEHWSLRNPLQVTLPYAESAYGRSKMDCSDCTSKVLDFMYLGKIQIQREHVEHVKLLSTILKVTELLLICEKFNSKQKHYAKRKSDFDSECVNKKQKEAIKCESSTVIENKIKPEVDIIKPDVNISCTRNDENNVFAYKAEVTGTTEKPNTPVFDKVDGFESRLSQIHFPESDKESIKSSADNKVENEKAADHFICSICKLKFSSMILLRQHRDTHRGRLHTCYACRFSSHKAFDLIKHLLEADHQETVCSLCFFEAKTPENLKEHLKMHNHPKPFFCSICNVRFHNRAALNTHTPKHSTEMPYSCNVCSRAFKWKQGLQSHMTVHTPEKKHLCPECGFSTAYQSTFRAHALVHTSNMLVCQHAGCSFKTVRKQNFVSHLKTHSKEKPYQCEVCGQAYSQAKNLRRHAVKHDAVAEEFVEHCPLCLYQTMRVDKLKIHFKKHHPEGDSTLLNLQRRKRRMLSLPKNIASNPETLVSENTVKSVTPLIEKTNQSLDKQNALPQGNIILMNDFQPSQDVQGYATFVLTALNTQLSKLCNGKDMQKSVNLHLNEEMVILLDSTNTNPVLVPTSQPYVMQTIENVGNTESIESANLDPEINSSQAESMPLRTERSQSDNILNSCINPKLLFTDNAHCSQVGFTNNEYLLKNSFVMQTVENVGGTDNIATANKDPEMNSSETESMPLRTEQSQSDNILNSCINPKLLFTDNAHCLQVGFTNNEYLLKNSKETTKMQSLSLDTLSMNTRFEDTFTNAQIPQSILDETSMFGNSVSSLINEQIQTLSKEEPSLDLINNNVKRQLFPDSAESSGLEDTSSMLDILSKEVPSLSKDQMLLCHETISDDGDNVQHETMSKDCSSQVLQSFKSFESILESL